MKPNRELAKEGMISRVEGRVKKWRGPHFTAYIDGEPYLRRWHLVFRNPWFSVYLHNFVQSDDVRALHDHPYANATLLIRGRYWEHNAHGKWLIPPWQLIRRKAEAPHRVELLLGKDGNPLPTWSLFFVGRRVRDWGFHCPGGWRSHRDYLRLMPGGNEVGPGCD